MNNIQVNSIDNIGFSNPNSNPNWNQVDGNKESIYFGKIEPNWRKKDKEIIDEQRKTMEDIEDAQREKSSPKEIIICGGGDLVLITALVNYKYVKK